jgi:hypothetical protein
MSNQPCEGCGKPAKGGHRFCYRCIGEILSQPSEQPQPTRERPGVYSYPPKKK